jgi:hypothetical protein
MTSKVVNATCGEKMDHSQRLASISLKLATAKAIDSWQNIPSTEREQLIDELEETSREMHSYAPKLAENLGMAIGVLDTTAHLTQFDSLFDDLQWLFDEFTRADSELKRRRK